MDLHPRRSGSSCGRSTVLPGCIEEDGESYNHMAGIAMSNNLETQLSEYAKSPAYPFHMPGHKRIMNPMEPSSVTTVLAGAAEDSADSSATDPLENHFPENDESSSAKDPASGIYALDITEIDGFDNLHDPQEILKTEMDRAANLWGARKTWFSVNGSTCAILVAISAAVPKGGRIHIERGCHMSVYHAAYLRELSLSYIDPNSEEAQAVSEIPDGTDAVVITSPSYEGAVRDIQLWANAAHEKGALLIVDEAHGAHLGFHPYFPESAVRLGADLVAQSTHKTLPAMTQTALLHAASDRIDTRKVDFFFDIYETSSPSYVLMASITAAMHLLENQRQKLFDDYVKRLVKVRSRLSSLTHFSLDGGSMPEASGEDRKRFDPGKLVIRVKYPGKCHLYKGREVYPDGSWLYELLRLEYHLQMEMRAPDYVLAMTSIADTDEGFDRLACAMEKIDRALTLTGDEGTRAEGAVGAGSSAGSAIKAQCRKAPETNEGIKKGLALPRCSLPMFKACEMKSELVPLGQAAGRIATDFVILYPPDAPLIVPGEEFSEELIRIIISYRERGFQIIGADDCSVLCAVSGMMN